MSNGNGHRWSKFWWQDWAADPALRKCSLAAQGLWMRLLCIMHEADPRGHLLIDGDPPTAKDLAAITGASLREIAALLKELKQAKVYSQTMRGVVYSRRMVKDTAASERGQHTGRLGGNPTLLAQREGRNPSEGLTPEVNPTPYPDPLTTPLNGTPYREGLTSPVNLEAEVQADSEVQAEERKEVLRKNSLPPTDGVGSRARGKNPPETPPDNLVALFAEAEIEQPKPGNADPELVKAHVRRVAKACEMRIPYGAVRGRADQITAAESPQPPVVEDVGYRWAPAEPVRTVEQQLAELERMMRAEAAQSIAADVRSP